jgi:multiple sugar transport system permease protein
MSSMAQISKLQPYLFLAPSFAILLVFLVFPLSWNIYIALHDVSLTTILKEWEYVGLENFVTLFDDSNFYTSLKVTLMFVGGSVALQFGVGMLMAIVLNQQIRGSGVYRAILIIPWTISAVVAAFSFKFILDDNFGILNYILNQLGFESVGWLSDPNIVIWSLVIANMWYGTPFTLLFLTAGLLSINPSLYEAARIDGASKMRSLFEAVYDN